MGLWYLSAVLFLAFSGLFWINSSDRLNATADYKTSVGGLFYACHQAGIAEVYGDGGFGTTGVATARTCRSTGANNMRRNDLAKNLNVSNVNIVAYRAADLGDSSAIYQNQRFVATYMLSTSRINGIKFNEVVRQVRSQFGDQISAGIVTAKEAGDPTGTYYKIKNDTGLLVRVPTSIPLNSFAFVSVLNTRGWPPGCTPSASGNSCFKSFPPANYADAHSACAADGGSLAKIKSVTDMNDIFSFGGGDPTWGYWVDGYDTNNNNQYYYYGTNTPVEYFDTNGNPLPIPWNPGEPNNYNGGEDCMNLYSNRHLNDLFCSYNIPFVCQY